MQLTSTRGLHGAANQALATQLRRIATCVVAMRCHQGAAHHSNLQSKDYHNPF